MPSVFLSLLIFAYDLEDFHAFTLFLPSRHLIKWFSPPSSLLTCPPSEESNQCWIISKLIPSSTNSSVENNIFLSLGHLEHATMFWEDDRHPPVLSFYMTLRLIAVATVMCSNRIFTTYRYYSYKKTAQKHVN